MSVPPKNIRALQELRQLELTWEDGAYRIPYKYVRGECPCAGCIEEWTGRKLLNMDTIPDDIRPTALKYSGQYAVKIHWSDGHDTGLYTWDHLRKISLDHGQRA